VPPAGKSTLRSLQFSRRRRRRPAVHLLRHTISSPGKDRKPVAAALKEIYRAVDADAGEAALTAFEEGYWGKK
jgi:transposase-like protein